MLIDFEVEWIGGLERGTETRMKIIRGFNSVLSEEQAIEIEFELERKNVKSIANDENLSSKGKFGRKSDGSKTKNEEQHWKKNQIRSPEIFNVKSIISRRIFINRICLIHSSPFLHLNNVPMSFLINRNHWINKHKLIKNSKHFSISPNEHDVERQPNIEHELIKNEITSPASPSLWSNLFSEKFEMISMNWKKDSGRKLDSRTMIIAADRYWKKLLSLPKGPNYSLFVWSSSSSSIICWIHCYSITRWYIQCIFLYTSLKTIHSCNWRKYIDG